MSDATDGDAEAHEPGTDEDDGPEPELFDGHGPDNEYLRLTIPEIALGTTIARANVDGSPKARRQARWMAWILILAFVLPIVGGLLLTALGAL